MNCAEFQKQTTWEKIVALSASLEGWIISIYAIFLFDIIALGLIYLFQVGNYVDGINSEAPIELAFDDESNSIYLSQFSSILITIPMALDLFLDFVFYWEGRRDKACCEGMVLTALVTIPNGLVLAYWNSPAIAYLFSVLHVIQYIGCLQAVLILCHKLIPVRQNPIALYRHLSHYDLSWPRQETFTGETILSIHITFSIASLFVVLG